jgi:hypothetical protein
VGIGSQDTAQMRITQDNDVVHTICCDLGNSRPKLKE